MKKILVVLLLVISCNSFAQSKNENNYDSKRICSVKSFYVDAIYYSDTLHSIYVDVAIDPKQSLSGTSIKVYKIFEDSPEKFYEFIIGLKNYPDNYPLGPHHLVSGVETGWIKWFGKPQVFIKVHGFSHYFEGKALEKIIDKFTLWAIENKVPYLE